MDQVLQVARGAPDRTANPDDEVRPAAQQVEGREDSIRRVGRVRVEHDGVRDSLLVDPLDSFEHGPPFPLRGLVQYRDAPLSGDFEGTVGRTSIDHDGYDPVARLIEPVQREFGDGAVETLLFV